MSLLSFKFSKAPNLFEILIISCLLTSGSVSSLRLHLSSSNFCAPCLHTATVFNFCNHQTVISITVSSPERLYNKYSSVPSPVYQYMINLIVSLPIWRSRCIYECVNVGTSCSLLDFLDVAKFTTLTPLSLLSWWKLSFPTVGLKISCLQFCFVS